MKPGWNSLAAEVVGTEAAMRTQEIKPPSNAEDESAIIREVEEENMDGSRPISPIDQRHSILKNQEIPKEAESNAEEVPVNRSITKNTNEELEKTYQAVIEPSVTLLENHNDIMITNGSQAETNSQA